MATRARLETTPTASEFEQLREEVSASRARMEGTPTAAVFAQLREETMSVATKAHASALHTTAAFEAIRKEWATNSLAEVAPEDTLHHVIPDAGEIRRGIQEVHSGDAFARLQDIVRASMPQVVEKVVHRMTRSTAFEECACWSFLPPMDDLRLVVEAEVEGSFSAASSGSKLFDCSMGLRLTASNESLQTSEAKRSIRGTGWTRQVVPLMMSHTTLAREPVCVRLWYCRGGDGDHAFVYNVLLKTSWHFVGGEGLP